MTTTAYTFDINEDVVTSSDARYALLATYSMFHNVGNVPVWVGQTQLFPGDVLKLDVEPPNQIKTNISIRFEDASVATNASGRIVSGKKLIVKTMNIRN